MENIKATFEAVLNGDEDASAEALECKLLEPSNTTHVEFLYGESYQGFKAEFTSGEVTNVFFSCADIEEFGLQQDMVVDGYPSRLVLETAGVKPQVAMKEIALR